MIELLEVPGLKGGHDNAAEAAVRPVDPAAEADEPDVDRSAAKRLSDMQAEGGIVLMCLEVGTIREADPWC
ncbi:hypothetical protein [Microvirga soli]|uniref:hypothetical protein n=1 Tax=Microvirga soli TaxID=1854496 RepID=UPI001FE4EF63|nr:hypothetical protein [Microvirga soli]